MALDKNKQKSINALMNKINASMKMEAVNMLGDVQDKMKIKFFKTPSHEVNAMLGGGICRGRITEIFGRESSGKTSLALEVIAKAQKEPGNENLMTAWLETEGCISEDCTILNPITGENITARELFETKKDYIVLSFNEDTKKIEEKPITNYFYNGFKEVYKIFTTTSDIELTENHKVLIYDKLSTLKWVRVDELKIGDMILRPKKIANVIGNRKCDFTDEELRLIGYMIGDGSYGKNSHSFSFTNIDDDLLQDFKYCVESVGAKVNKIDDRHYGISRPKGKGGTTERNNAQLLFDRLNLTGQICSEKTIPSELYSLSDDKIANILSGLFMTDGCVTNPDTRLTVDFSNTSKNLIYQVRNLLSRFGIIAKMRTIEYENENHKTGYRLIIDGYDQLKLFYENIPMIGYKKDRLESGLAKDRKCISPSLGYYYPDYDNAKCYRKRDKYINTTDCYFSKITNIKNIGKKNTYDFTVSDNHNLFVNDILIHNSVDTEYLDYFGIDKDRILIINQTEELSAEKCMDILRSLISSGEFEILVMNSIAGLLPSKEVEDDMQKQNIALTARLLSKFFRITTGMLTKNNATLILINQVRTNLNSMYATNTTTGGMSIPFYSSQRIEMKREKVMAGDPISEDDGVKIRCKVVKNRLAKGNPYKVCNYYALYGKGIDGVSELGTVLAREGVLTKAGSWLKLIDENDNLMQVKTASGMVDAKWQSNAKFVEFLRENPTARLYFEELLDEKLSSGKVVGNSVSKEEMEELEQLNINVETSIEEIATTK